MFYNGAYLIKGLYVTLSTDGFLSSAKFSQIDNYQLKQLDKEKLGAAKLDGIKTKMEKAGGLKTLYKV